MRKTTLFLLVSFSFIFASYAGLSIGLPGAVKKQVSKLDDKVLTATKVKNTPAALSALAGNGAVEITWSPVSGASSYNLYLGNTPQLQAIRPLSKTAQVTSPYVLTGLTNDVPYYYAISSVADGIESNLSPVSQIVPSSSLPLRPEGVAGDNGLGQITLSRGDNGYGQITLSWNPVLGASSYNIYWSASAGVTKVSPYIIRGVTSPYPHINLPYGQTYHYRVSAVNTSGESVLSAEMVSTTLTQPLSYPIDPLVYTTLERTIVPVAVPSSSPALFPHETSKFSQYGYGVWQFSPGLASEKRTDLMSAAYTTATVTNTANLLRFFTMSDIHIQDKESPSQMIYFGYNGGNSSGYSPQLLYTTHVLDSAVQTINALHKKYPFDFGLALGDAANNAQYNELRWYIDVIDGKTINPDSGVKDDPVPGLNNDYQDEYKAVGLDSAINWYQTLGNHDHAWMGSWPVIDYLKQAYTSSTVLLLGAFDTAPEGIDVRTTYTGVIDGSTPDGAMIGGGLVGSFTTPPTTPADPNRRSLSKKEWMNEFLTTTSKPAGHGFTQSNVDNDFACYSFEPKSNLPIKVIVLDDTQMEDSTFDFHEQGIIDQRRFDWLVSELDEGQANDKLMIIAAHIPLIYIDVAHKSPIPLVTLLAKLHTYPNLLMWVSGHVHRNMVTALKSSDVENHPEFGFWLVETASLKDFPQQFRTFDIVRNSDNTISILTADVDPAVKDGSFAAISRSYAVAAYEIFPNSPISSPAALKPTGSYNAELIKQLSPDMQAKIQNYGTPIP